MTGIGNLYSLFVSWYGLTAGDRLIIKDGTTVMMEIVFTNTGANGMSVDLPAVGLEFGTSLVVLPVITGGELNVAIGYAGNG